VASEFFVLDSGPNDETLEGCVWDESARMADGFSAKLLEGYYPSSNRCPIHRWDIGGITIPATSVELAQRRIRDFVWTPGDCLLPERTLNLFLEAGFTGFEAVPMKVAHIRRYRGTDFPKLWLLKVTGRAGPEVPQAGRVRGEPCPYCGCREGSVNTIDGIYVDPERWDGSDFSFCDGHEGIIVITARVKDLIIENKLEEVTIFEAEKFPMYGTDRGPNIQEIIQENMKRIRAYDRRIWGKQSGQNHRDD